ncbi:hypothetical protein BJV82DRAFT_86802 [Fennellomyces sp. T-0311]|nr:hypothetical protein BJV82DRAFT_86802 [Fennellomyces sp. T-0311]
MDNSIMRFFSLLTFILCTFPYYTYSYCVYNRHHDDTYLDVHQYKVKPGLGAFHQPVFPNGKECCPYTDPDCNPDPSDRMSTVRLHIRRFNHGEITQFSVFLTAGGSVIVDGDKVNHTVAVKLPDGITDDPRAEISYAAEYDEVHLPRGYDDDKKILKHSDAMK